MLAVRAEAAAALETAKRSLNDARKDQEKAEANLVKVRAEAAAAEANAKAALTEVEGERDKAKDQLAEALKERDAMRAELDTATAKINAAWTHGKRLQDAARAAFDEAEEKAKKAETAATAATAANETKLAEAASAAKAELAEAAAELARTKAIVQETQKELATAKAKHDSAALLQANKFLINTITKDAAIQEYLNEHNIDVILKYIFKQKIDHSSKYQQFTDNNNTIIYFDKITLFDKNKEGKYKVKVHVAIKNEKENNYHFYETTIKNKDGKGDYFYSNNITESQSPNGDIVLNDSNDTKFTEIFTEITKQITIT